MKFLEVPILPSQQQDLSLSLLGVSYRLRLRWRYAVQTWFMDILDARGVPKLMGLALVRGGNLLHQHRGLGMGVGLVVVCDVGTLAPTFENLGVSSHLLFVTP